MRLQSEDGRVSVVLGDSPQDQKRAKILLADRWVALPDAPVVADAEGAPGTTDEAPSEFAGMTKADLAAHLEAVGRDPKELRGLKLNELRALAEEIADEARKAMKADAAAKKAAGNEAENATDAADAEAAKTDGEEETQP